MSGWFYLAPSIVVMKPWQAESASSPSLIWIAYPSQNHFLHCCLWPLTAPISQNNIHYFFITNPVNIHGFSYPSVSPIPVGSQMWRTHDPLHFKNVGMFFVKHSLQSLSILHRLKQMIPKGSRAISLRLFWYAQHQMEFQTRAILKATSKVTRRFKVLCDRSMSSWNPYGDDSS